MNGHVKELLRRLPHIIWIGLKTKSFIVGSQVVIIHLDWSVYVERMQESLSDN